jgi:peptidyl-dipeptidase A
MNTPLDFSQFADFLKWHQERAEPLEREASDAWWQANVTASPASEERTAAAQKALTRLYANREAFAYLRDLDTTALSPEETRQYTLLRNSFTGNQMDDAVIEELVDTERRVETLYNTHRPLFRGEPTGENTLRDVLRTSNDSQERFDAWESSKEIGNLVATDVLRLVALRNQEARRLGYPNYYAMSLSLQEQDIDALFTLLTDLSEKSEPLFRAYKAELDTELTTRFGVRKLYPWHYSDPFFQDAPPGAVDFDPFYKDKNLETLTTAFFDNIGLDVRDILARSDLYERENKCQHAFCVHVGRFEDVRVLCNNTNSERWMGTMLHEFGHAVYDKYLGADLPFFLRDVSHTLTTEAIAMLMGRQSKSAAFLARYVSVPKAEAEAVAEAGRREMQVQLLIFIRWVLVMTHFERAMYEDPARDLNRLWWQLVEKYQGIHPPEDRNAPDWAAKLHLALAPVYYHNYLMGEMMASQLLEYLRRAVLPDSSDETLITSPLVGQYLTEKIFAPGARLRWDDLIASATGEPLNAAYLVGHLHSG